MKKLLTILLVLISFSTFAQFEAGEYVNSDTLKNKGSSIIYPQADSVEQFYYSKMRDPSEPLDGVNLRTLFDRLASLDTLGLNVSDLVSGSQLINAGETQIFFPSAFDSTNVIVVPFVRRISDDAVIDFIINDIDSLGFDVVVWEDSCKIQYVASQKITHSSDIFKEPIYSADSTYLKSHVRNDFDLDSTNEIQDLSGLVPFLGADRDVDLGLNSINTDTVKIDGVPLLLNTFKKGNLGGAGTIPLSNGSTSTPSWSTVYSAIATTPTQNYIPKFGSSKLENSSIYSAANIGINTNNPYAKLTVIGSAVANPHYDLFLANSGFLMESQEGRMQLVASNGGTGGAGIVFTNAPYTGDNTHWNINHVGSAIGDGLVFRWSKTAGTGQDTYAPLGFINTMYLSELGMMSLGFTAPLTKLDQGQFSANALGSYHSFSKSRNATQGLHTIVQNNDVIGGLQFRPSDGTDFGTISAQIHAVVNDTSPAASSIAADIVFSTAKGIGTDDLTEAMKLTSIGNLNLLSGSYQLASISLLLDHLKSGSLGGAGTIPYSVGSTNTPLWGSINQVIGGNSLSANYVPKWDGNKLANSNIYQDGSGNVGIGATTPLSKLSINGGLHVGGDSDAGDNNILADGTVAGTQLISTIPTGTPPLVVASSTKVDSLNADLLDGKNASDFLKYTDPVIESDTIKARADIIVTGEIYDKINHLYGMVYDSTITLSLTQNVWQQVTNPTKTLYSTSEQDGITISSDTIVFSKAGGYDVYFEFNCTGINSKDYHYRILQKNGTTTVRSYNKYASTGTKVVRNEKAYIHVVAGSKVWCEIMSPSSAPGSITIQGAKVYAMQHYLEK